ncbi:MULTISPECIES: DUF2993 domain-containing protein [unclassified Actinomyces]|uniref:DUF2993 domain-containing protein n=2 Tax=Actinomyces TaxID=1654 RepID=UPI002016F8B6|nr:MULTISPECIES: DUF2993 domain-containing protein [unclassified Actinomyces]MCL3777799.1 hypothetical protein [Actinomyces sp. AC-20-1]MCL3790821.1 hypothetical protein [Actinomyces sp. 187325]MCL3792693.1 hypothetical protein [Actinomyces sp. 186855]MCL3795577.1 hypothetical protein [Actinomyces sp. 217892]
MSEPGDLPEAEPVPAAPAASGTAWDEPAAGPAGDERAPEGPGPAGALPDEEEPAGRPSRSCRPPRPGRPRRPGRRALVVLIALILLLLAAAAAGAEHLVRGRVGAVVRAAVPGLCADAEARTQGLLLTQLLTGSLDTLTLTSSCLHLEQQGEDTALDLRDVTATLTGVGLRSPHPARSLDATGTITWEDLGTLIANASPTLDQVAAAPEEHGTVTAPGAFTVTCEVLGADAVLLVVPSLTQDGGLLMTVTRATVAGVGLDLAGEDSLATTLLGTPVPEVVLDRDLLPHGLSFSAVVVTEEGLRVSMSGQDLELATLSR